MAFFYSRIVNIFQRKHRSAAPDDYRQYVLERLFPSIRYGRDIDLERYIMMRENKKNSMEWGSAYQSLAFRYTEGERKRLIRSFRKKQGIFEKVFAQIMDELFRRVVQNLKNRIDILLQEFKVINQASRSSRDAMLLSGIERIVGLCSPEKDGAAEGAEFYLDFARHLGYRQNELVPVVTLVQGYADGSLFEEAAVKEAYRFDIREEYRKHHRLKPQRKQAFTLQLLITEEDIASIVVATEDMNEYEQTYEYFSRYLPLAGNREFATKIYAYSKKHQTSHFRIFEAVR
ncbi:MAG: hypothetical protein EHM28_05975, partial [Spirochaetaceae bacterium]